MSKLPRYWKPLQRANYLAPPSEKLIAECQAQYQLDREAALAKIEELSRLCEYWVNPLYQVEVRRYDLFVHLNIRRRDGAPIHDWRHLQQIKNELIGPECEAVELYPAESRLVDTSNKYHLFGMADPNARLPFGIDAGQRDVQDDDGNREPGMRQRKL